MVAVDVPKDRDEALKQYETDPVTYNIVRLQASRRDMDPVELLTTRLGCEVWVPNELAGVLDD